MISPVVKARDVILLGIGGFCQKRLRGFAIMAGMSYEMLGLVGTIVGLVLGLVLHEFAHAWMGHYLGDTSAKDQGRLTLNPMAHIDPFATLLLPLFLIIAGLPVFAAAKPVPFNPWALRGGRWGAAAVAAAGPFTNLIIALICSVWLHLVAGGSPAAFVVLGSIIAVNCGLFIFNLIPIPPLDGSRILYAVAPPGLRQGMDNLERMGLMVIFGLVLLLSYTPIGRILSQTIKGLTAMLLPNSFLP
jgi:Zn-dependent protease